MVTRMWDWIKERLCIQFFFWKRIWPVVWAEECLQSSWWRLTWRNVVLKVSNVTQNSTPHSEHLQTLSIFFMKWHQQLLQRRIQDAWSWRSSFDTYLLERPKVVSIDSLVRSWAVLILRTGCARRSHANRSWNLSFLILKMGCDSLTFTGTISYSRGSLWIAGAAENWMSFQFEV